ncbi:type II secretion system F family protein [Hydrogenophaga sp. PAMC20947]|uniref:type II secretion system F family protein n=1 Tax=Hydrogenophaga sp. PAMC20947 TaxID=2565558 RepID=UPI00109E2474|nr:type II secretion system F family protein [Hydrogenophaga sp. PAMC20947]QCB45681.1 type II secretion system F family protein [Hydrogenophaga sp. PAMC20947]
MRQLNVSPSGFAFELIVRTAHGHVQTLELMATDASAATERAVRDGLQVLACKALGSRRDKNASNRGGGRGKLDIANFAYELGSLMGAGLSVVEALKTLAANEGTHANRDIILGIVKRIGEGLPLSAALQTPPGRFPALLIATVSASEQTGDLSTSLARYAAHQLTIKSLKDKVVGTAVYPALLLTVGILVVLFLMTVVVPKFAVLIESTRHELPWSSQLLMSWGRFASRHVWELVIVVIAAVVALIMLSRSVMKGDGKAAWLERVPFVGPTMRKFRHAQLYRTTGMLVRGGITAPKALQLSASLLGASDQKRLTDAIRLVQEGRSLSDALHEAQLADPIACSMLTVAERTGELAEMLERIAQFHESRLQRSVELTSRLFEPVLMIFIGLVVGAIVVLMYLPIFDLASSLQ